MEADDAQWALSILEANAQFIQVLFTDIDMPGMNGVFLASHVRKRWPWVGIVMTSGAVRPSPIALPDGVRFFSKPFIAADVVAHIHEVALAAA
jgi:two-component system, response regulator PdtaR